MDSNAHSSLWGCPSDNPRGKTLEELIIGMGADILNVGTQPTFSNHRYSTIIDITHSDPSLSPSLSNWRIHDTPSLSDHAAIRVDLNLTPPPPPYPYVSGKMLIGFSSNPSFMAYPPSPFYGMKPLLKLSVTSFTTQSMKPWTLPAPNN